MSTPLPTYTASFAVKELQYDSKLEGYDLDIAVGGILRYLHRNSYSIPSPYAGTNISHECALFEDGTFVQLSGNKPQHWTSAKIEVYHMTDSDKSGLVEILKGEAVKAVDNFRK